jgi:hypothetical protein
VGSALEAYWHEGSLSVEGVCGVLEGQVVRVVGGDVYPLDSISECEVQGRVLMIRSLLQIDLGYSRRSWIRSGCERGFRTGSPDRMMLVRWMG